MMAQGVLGFQYEGSETGGATALAGLPLYFELGVVAGLVDSIQARLKVRAQGWSDVAVVMSLILLQLAGGESVDDIGKLQADEGFQRLMVEVLSQAFPRKERRRAIRQWRKERRKGKEAAFPSPSSILRYLSAFHDPEQDKRREEALAAGVKAFIPAENEHLRAISEINKDLLSWNQRRSPQKRATLDMDATLIEVAKSAALFCYKHFRAYQPLNVYWFEQDQVVYSQFRDGNVPAGYRQLPVLKYALELLPEGVDEVFLRTDTAGYEWDLLRYCAEGNNERFGVIPFCVGVDVTPEFKKAVAQVPSSEWKPLLRKIDGMEIDTGQQYAEVCFVPNAAATKKHGPQYRFLAIREPLAQLEIPGVENQGELPFPTMDFQQSGRHKLFGAVTNLDWSGDEVIWWHRQRCGKSEEVHSVMKSDLAGGKLPSGQFGANAAWWGIMLLALNLNSIMKRLVLGEGWANKRIKAVRFWLINLPGRVVRHARRLIIRLSASHPALTLLERIRTRILALVPEPGG